MATLNHGIAPLETISWMLRNYCLSQVLATPSDPKHSHTVAMPSTSPTLFGQFLFEMALSLCECFLLTRRILRIPARALFVCKSV
jgi:hypothetical protein